MNVYRGAYVHCSFRLTYENQEYLRAVAFESHSTYSRAINCELDFLRTWSLPLPLTTSLEVEATRRGLSSFEFVRTLVYEYARELPRVPGTKLTKRLGRPTTVQLSAPNVELLGRIDTETLPGACEIDAALGFCRTYGLPADLLASLEAEALRQHCSVREVVRTQLWAAAEAFARGSNGRSAS